MAFSRNRSLGMMRGVWWLLVFGLLLSWTAGAAAAGWRAGVARVVITPEESMWLSGYGARTKPADGTVQDLQARAAALESPHGTTAVFVATDLITVPASMAARIAAAVEEKHGVPRAQLMLTCSHTHCGPALDDNLSHMLAMDADDWVQVRRYQEILDAKLLALIDEALANRQPARLAWGVGGTDFANNRRPPIGEGPTDHDVPVLKITKPDGELLGAIFGYACHNTTMSFDKWCGDYAGFAQYYLEDRHPGAVAMFFAGCGGDQNPLPRRKLELCEKYGRMLGGAVDAVLATEMAPIEDGLRCGFKTVDLEFAHLPDEAELAEWLADGNRYEKARARFLLARLEADGELAAAYPYPIQVWRLGPELIWVALGGEVVVDYSLRLKRELGAENTFVAGYANDVMAYIPSERVLGEGGYEGGGAMVYYQQPSPWKPGLEAQIVGAVRDMAERLKSKTEVPALFDGKTLANWKVTKFGGEGAVRVGDNGTIVLESGSPMTGITWDGPKLPRSDYELTLEAKRVDGSDFFCGLTFPCNGDPCSLILGGWGGGVVGLSSIDGFDASENETTQYIPFKNDRWYKVRLRVTKPKIEAWLDDEQIIDQEIIDRDISIRIEVELSKPLGISTYTTTAALRNLKLRKLTDQEIRRVAESVGQ